MVEVVFWWWWCRLVFFNVVVVVVAMVVWVVYIFWWCFSFLSVGRSCEQLKMRCDSSLSSTVMSG